MRKKHKKKKKTYKTYIALITIAIIALTLFVYFQLNPLNQTIDDKYERYFGIHPKFIENLNGRFDNSIVIMMGCDGLPYVNTKNSSGETTTVWYYGMGKAFVEKGAKVFISWTGPVSQSHTDQVTARLLYHLITENLTIKKAIQESFIDVGGPDPIFKSLLMCYPIEVGDETISEFPLSVPLKASIVDHLSYRDETKNESFVRTTTNILKQAGYTVDYYPGEEVTVNFYRDLTSYGQVIILRVHSALSKEREPPVVLFTSEPYDKTKYTYEQLTNQISIARILSNTTESESEEPG